MALALEYPKTVYGTSASGETACPMERDVGGMQKKVIDTQVISERINNTDVVNTTGLTAIGISENSVTERLLDTANTGGPTAIIISENFRKTNITEMVSIGGEMVTFTEGNSKMACMCGAYMFLPKRGVMRVS